MDDRELAFAGAAEAGAACWPTEPSPRPRCSMCTWSASRGSIPNYGPIASCLADSAREAGGRRAGPTRRG